MGKCYLSKNYKELYSAGSKAKTDVESILEKAGYRNVGLKQTHYRNKIWGFLVTLLGVLKVPFSLRRGDVLVIQYPFKKYYSFICNMAHMRGCKVVTLVHDLGSFRRKRLTISKEIKRLNHSDYIIALNQNMKEWLLQHNSKSQIGCLQIWDYLSMENSTNTEIPSLPFVVVYAGSLSYKKNSFLYELKKTSDYYHFDLYGSGFDVDKVIDKGMFTYRGFVPSDQLISTAKGHFGLVWDGDSASTCSGAYGEYLQYNNPHKTSLYIRCLLPIIIWEKAALAPFIKSNKIGICIASLDDLDTILASMTIQDYNEMKKNVVKMSQDLSNGRYITDAVNDAYRYCTSNTAIPQPK